jgi:hypothetical protein
MRQIHVFGPFRPTPGVNRKTFSSFFFVIAETLFRPQVSPSPKKMHCIVKDTLPPFQSHDLN